MTVNININDISDKKELEALLKLAQALLGKTDKVDIEDKPIVKHKCAVKRKFKTVRTARSKYWDALADMPEVYGTRGVLKFLQENGRLDHLPECVLEELKQGNDTRAVSLFAPTVSALLKAQCPCIKRGSKPNTYVGNLTQYGQKITNIFC